MSTRTPSSSSSRLMLTIGLCFLVALMEGLDLQAAGIAAGGIAQAFALDKMQMGWIFSAGILGLLPGALVGGMLADRYGRKRILIGSVALFGLFSLATAIAWDFPSLVFARLMTGVGLGAALPNLIALTSEAAGPRFRGTAVSLMYCGVPIGAALAATLGFAGANLAWQTVFWVGGVVPLILVPLLMRWLPESAVFAGEKQAAPPLRALFAPETATATLLLWLCYFFTLLVVYMLINWLPLLLVEQGFQPSQAAGVMFALQMGAASGTLMLGALMDKLRPVTMSLLIYSGMLASLLALGTVSSFNGMLLAGFVAGLFATGGQSVLYALAPLFYSSQIRATGVGTAVAVGRLGAMSGPLLAGKMLALGTGTVGVMAASAPGILVAGLAVFILMSRRSRMQPCADALTRLIKQGRKGVAPNTPTAFTGILAKNYSAGLETKMAKLTLQEQLLKAGLVTSKKAAKVERTAKKSRVQAREARAAVEENKKAQLERDKQLSEQQKQAALAKEYKAQVKQLIEMNRITIANGDIGFNFTDGNLIKKIFVDKLTQAQLINGRLAIARLLVDNNSEGELRHYSRQRCR
ncbi:hypothetical protein VEE15_20160 [Escherichia coli]|nr:hypothetical protein VEE15_20160 [Escherichia coli]